LAIGLYPGSFDPVTKGHVDIAERAAPLFEEMVVAIYDNPPKDVLFTTEERVELMRKALAHVPNIRVVSYNSLTVEFAKKVKASVMVRGLRMSSDFEREFEMALMNKKLAPEIELICLMTNLEYEFVSATLLKEICMLGGSIEEFVPGHVAIALREKFGVK
jgi:pantetheine-phosphate adenylyltransferase